MYETMHVRVCVCVCVREGVGEGFQDKNPLLLSDAFITMPNLDLVLQ